MKKRNYRLIECNMPFVWIILGIIVFIGVLAYFEVFNPENYNPQENLNPDFLYSNETGQYNLTISQASCIMQCQETLIEAGRENKDINQTKVRVYFNQCVDKCIEVFK